MECAKYSGLRYMRVVLRGDVGSTEFCLGGEKVPVV
jgi:hypothetical protein